MARNFVLFATLCVREHRDAVANGQTRRYLNALRFTLVLAKLTPHKNYLLAILQTLVNLLCVLSARDAGDVVATMFVAGRAQRRKGIDCSIEHVVWHTRRVVGNVKGSLETDHVRSASSTAALLQQFGVEFDQARDRDERAGRHVENESHRATQRDAIKKYILSTNLRVYSEARRRQAHDDSDEHKVPGALGIGDAIEATSSYVDRKLRLLKA